MTKRILAVVLALAMCLTMLSVQAFAIDNWTLDAPTITDNANGTSKTVTFNWNAPAGGADYYTVTVALGNNNIVKDTRVTNTTYTFTANTSGDYSIVVRAYKNASSIETAIYSGTASIFIAQSSTGTNGLKVSSVDNSHTKVEWNAQPGNPTYYVAYTLSNGNTGGVEAGTNNYYTLPFGYSEIRSINVYQGTASSHTTTPLASWTNNGSSGTSGGYGTGGVGLSGSTLYWSSYGTNVYYFVYFYLGNSTVRNSVTSSPTQATNVSVASILSSYGYSSSITFEVVLASTNQVIGTYYYNGGYNNGSSSYYGFNVSPTYTGYATAYWNAYTGAENYLVTATVNGATTYTNSVTATSDSGIRYTFGQVTTITVQAAAKGRILATIGTATINANGQVSYAGSNGNQGWWGSSSTNGNTQPGYNCILTVGTSSSYLQWNSTVPGPYSILLIPEGGLSQTYNVGASTSCSLPVGQTTSFQVIVYATDTRTTVAQASYTASASNNKNVKSSITNLTVSNTATNSTTISWTAVSGATSYEIEYGALSSIYYNTGTTRTTSFTLPYGKNADFEAYVYAYVGTVRRSVGSIVHIAGDDFTSSNDKKDDNKTDTTKPADTTPAYVTGFKGTVGTSGTITLAWNAASGKPTYEVYYKKTSSSTWKKLYSTTARSLKVNGLTNNTSYDFKVVANSKDSGILTMTIGTTSSTKTAADPGATSSASAPSLNSVNGGKGTITASWTSVSGANLYRVYIAEDSSTNYKTKTSTWSTSGTSITLSGVSKGTYKVRVKASTDNGKTWTNLSDCDYLTVTVQ